MNRHVSCVFLSLLLSWNFAAAARVEPNPPPIPPAAVISADNPSQFDAQTATRAWLDTVPPEKRAQSDAYFEGAYWLLLWDFLLSAAISIFLLQSRISARLRDWTERVTWSKSLQVVLYVIPYVIIVAVLSFPLIVYEQFYREHKYGLATQTFGPWFTEQLEMFGIALIEVPVGLLILYAVFRRTPRTWWIWGTAVAVVFTIFGNLVQPVFIDPIFNKYRTVNDPAIRDPILTMARANQIPVSQVFEFDASRQTTRVSANVAGLLGTTRIALNDNLLKQCTLPEIRAVMAHEMGHYILNHGAKLVIYFGCFALVGFALIKIIFDRALLRWGQKWEVRGIADPAGLPLLALILATLLFLLTPLINTTVRVTEREADQFGLNVAREPDGAATVALKLGAYRKLDPGPIEEFFFFDHPSGRARIRMAMDWKAAQLPCGPIDSEKMNSP